MDQVPSPTAPATGELSFCQGAERDSRLPFGDGRLKQSMLGESMLDCMPLPFFFFFSLHFALPSFLHPLFCFPTCSFPTFLVLFICACSFGRHSYCR